MSPWIFVILAVVSNVCLNLSLKGLSGSLSPGAEGSLVLRIVVSPFAWLALICGLVLLGSFTMAIRSLPLSMTYSVITGAAMALLALVGLLAGYEQLSLPRLAGLSMVIVGIAVMRQST